MEPVKLTSKLSKQKDRFEITINRQKEFAKIAQLFPITKGQSDGIPITLKYGQCFKEAHIHKYRNSHHHISGNAEESLRTILNNMGLGDREELSLSFEIVCTIS